VNGQIDLVVTDINMTCALSSRANLRFRPTPQQDFEFFLPTDKSGSQDGPSSHRTAYAICPAIPYRSNTKDMPAFFPKTLYKARARIEQAVGKLKRFKRIALRCEKTAQNYGSFVALALGFILIKSVHTA
jgi:hypothetical protein